MKELRSHHQERGRVSRSILGSPHKDLSESLIPKFNVITHSKTGIRSVSSIGFQMFSLLNWERVSRWDKDLTIRQFLYVRPVFYHLIRVIRYVKVNKENVE